MSLSIIERWSFEIYELAFFLGLGLLTFEILRELLTGRLRKLTIYDSLASLSTQIPFYFTEAVTFGATIVVYYTLHDEVVPWHLPVEAWTLVLAVLAADFVYYWEHRISHEVRLLWVSHAVHHSAPIMNTSVAFRFGAFDPMIAAVSHLPLILIGFDPLLVIFGELVVLSYQTWIHTEVIGRLGPLDRVLNTPSNHRVHHGADDKYLDKNYGGILMLWDQLFGTYQREEETPRYGLKTPLNSSNPFRVWFSEIPGLYRDLAGARSSGEALRYLLRPPGWRPLDRRPVERMPVERTPVDRRPANL